MRRAIDETDRRRTKQVEFNTLHGIEPRGVQKQVREMIDGVYDAPVGEDRAEGGAGEGALRRDGREARGARDQAAGEGDARSRAQPGIRGGGASAGPARAVAPAGIRRRRRRFDDRRWPTAARRGTGPPDVTAHDRERGGDPRRSPVSVSTHRQGEKHAEVRSVQDSDRLHGQHLPIADGRSGLPREGPRGRSREARRRRVRRHARLP